MIVDKLIIPTLQSRYYISRETGLFDTVELTFLWKVSPRTLIRYIDKRDREISRIAARRTHLRLKSLKTGL